MDAVEFFKILSDKTRLRILLLLQKREICVCDLTEILELDQPKVSKHLSKMRDNKLVEVRRNRQRIFYSLKLEPGYKDILEDVLRVSEGDQDVQGDTLKFANKKDFHNFEENE